MRGDRCLARASPTCHRPLAESVFCGGDRGGGEAHSPTRLKVPSQTVGSLEQMVPAAVHTASHGASSSSEARRTPPVRPRGARRAAGGHLEARTSLKRLGLQR